jgi:hypothetical protein
VVPKKHQLESQDEHAESKELPTREENQQNSNRRKQKKRKPNVVGNHWKHGACRPGSNCRFLQDGNVKKSESNISTERKPNSLYAAVCSFCLSADCLVIERPDGKGEYGSVAGIA